MTRPTTSRIHRPLRLLLPVLVAVLGSTVAATPVAAKDRSGYQRDDHRYERRWDDRDRREWHDHRYDDPRRYDSRRDDYRYRGRHQPRRSFVVPRHLGHDPYHAYSPYRYGRAYYGPHHHYHEVYFFPVLVGGVYRYQPHYYCEGDLYSTGVYLDGYYGPRSRLSFGFRFDF